MDDEATEEENECIVCGNSVDSIDTMCENCEHEEQEEEQHNDCAKILTEYIEVSLGITSTKTSGDLYSTFKWKPTPSTEIEIKIYKYDNNEDVEYFLRHQGRKVRYESMELDDAIANDCFETNEMIGSILLQSRKY